MKTPHLALLSAQRGLSLIELMVAMLIGIMIIAAVGTIALSNQSTFRSSQAISEIQDGARTAFELMSKDIRQAGDDGCGNGKITPLTANNDAWWAGSPTNDAWPGAVDIRSSLSGVVGSTPSIAAGSNVLIVLGAGSNIRSVAADVTSGGDTINIFPAGTPFSVGQYVLVCDWDNPAQFATVKSVTNNTVTLTEPLTHDIHHNGVISNYNAVAWYIHEDATNGNIPTLWRVAHDQTGTADTPVAILPGVTQMTVRARAKGASDFTDYASIANKNEIDAIQIEYTMVGLSKNTAIQADTDVQNSENRVQRQYLFVVPLNNRTNKGVTVTPSP